MTGEWKMYESPNAWLKRGKNKWIKWIIEWIKVWQDEWKNRKWEKELVNEWMKKGTNIWKNDRIKY